MNDENVFLAKIQQVIKLLDEIDDIIDTNPERQRNIDWEISDYLHIIEQNDLSDKSKLEISDCLKRCRIFRRHSNNIQAIGKVFNDNRGKLVNKHSREILYSMMSNVVNKLDCDYKHRVLDEKTINELCDDKEDKKDVVKKSSKQICISKEDLITRLQSGERLTDIANDLNVSISHLSHVKTKYGIKNRTYTKRG